MITLLSPSKGQDFTTLSANVPSSLSDFLPQSEQLIDELKNYKSEEIQQLMSVSKNIADLNVDRFRNFTFPFTAKNSKQAIFAFTGDVYSRIAVEEYSGDELDFAQKHLRILSGLYGCLRPLDLIQAYRLEMKTPLATTNGKNLYQFWDDHITLHLNIILEDHENKFIINLASTEYFKVVKAKLLQAKLVTISFKEIKDDKPRVVAIFAKRARGLMADFIIRNNIDSIESLKQFTRDGYCYDENLSDSKLLTFTRPQPIKT